MSHHCVSAARSGTPGAQGAVVMCRRLLLELQSTCYTGRAQLDRNTLLSGGRSRNLSHCNDGRKIAELSTHIPVIWPARCTVAMTGAKNAELSMVSARHSHCTRSASVPDHCNDGLSRLGNFPTHRRAKLRPRSPGYFLLTIKSRAPSYFSGQP